MKNKKLYKERLQFLKRVKKHIITFGWNDTVLQKFIENNKISKKEFKILFPEGYKSILKFYFYNADQEMILKCKKINLKKFRTHEKVREIILTRLNLNIKDKELIKKTFPPLLFPSNCNISIDSLHNTINEIWTIVGDNSSGYNYYSKRLILSGIYISTFFYWITKNPTNEEIRIFLNLQLKQINKIPKFKEKFKSYIKLFSNKYSLSKNFSNIKQ